jgi:hypothetical protein
MFQIPALVFSLILASLYAAAFQFWLGHSLRDLLFFWLAAAVGFATGQLGGTLLNVIPWTIGQVHVVEASFVSLLFLVMARWLRQEKKAV